MVNILYKIGLELIIKVGRLIDDLNIFLFFRHDEWISVNSPRLRPFSTSPIPTTSNSETDNVEVPIIKEEVKQDEKSKLKFVIGERCLARWRDNRRFIATINKDLGNGELSYDMTNLY